jgi:A/G-specific adenine glycosylase
MLQQTRVETVIPYWQRFMAALPTVQALAEASEEAVLALWSGLGYYRRARSLREAARVVAGELGGVFPRTRAGWLALPGIGPYTAGAVLSIAFDLPEPLVDGNAARVLARLFAVEGVVSRAAVKGELWALAAWLVPEHGGAGEFNQALMELGARVCAPREPDCGACPLRGECRALRAGAVERLPQLPARPAPRRVELVAVLEERGGEVLLERRAPRGRMAGMWQLPTAELPDAEGRLTGLFPDRLPHGLEAASELFRLRHGITCHRIALRVCAARRAPGGLRAGGGGGDGASPPLAWIPRPELDRLPLTGMAKKALRAAFSRPDLAQSAVLRRGETRWKPIAGRYAPPGPAGGLLQPMRAGP